MVTDGYYERAERLVSAASDVLTVGYVGYLESLGEPWPISGDATAIMNGAAK